MKPNIRLLEQRIRQVVDRLRETAEERDRLQGELETLRSRLDAFEGAPDAEDVPASDWTANLGEVRGVLREAIEELRAD